MKYGVANGMETKGISETEAKQIMEKAGMKKEVVEEVIKCVEDGTVDSFLMNGKYSTLTIKK